MSTVVSFAQNGLWSIEKAKKWEMLLMEELGMNCVRVVLQYVVYEDDPDYFIQTFDHFLNICNKHRIKVMPVFLMIVYLV